MKSNYDGRTLVADMIDSCSDVVERDAAIKGIREICKFFGGQMLYLAKFKSDGDTTEELRGILSDAVGDGAGERMLQKLMITFGGIQLYIPMEKNAFREVIAREIYDRYDGTNAKIKDLCREYGLSFTKVYRLWAEGRDNKNQMLFDFGDNQ